MREHLFGIIVLFVLLVAAQVCGQPSPDPTDNPMMYSTDYSFDGVFSAAVAASEDVGDTAGQSALAQSMLRNTVNLTRQNARCDELIAKNLEAHSSDKLTQPVIPITIDIKMILITLNDISDVDGTISLTSRIDFRWFDKRLALPANESCDGQSLLVKTQSLWFPYFIIQNGASNVFYPTAWEKFPSSLRADGFVDWRVAFQFDLSCDFNFTIFPFDSQYCRLLLQSPHYSGGELVYNVTDTSKGVVFFDKDDSDHPMWQITGQAVRYTVKVPGVIFSMSFRRKYMYYIWTIAIPVLAVSLLTASAFIVPANGEEKLSTVINALLSFFLLYLLFVDAIPADSTKTPLLMVYFSVQIILTTFEVIVCAVMMRIYGLEQAEEELARNEEEEAEDNLSRRAGLHGINSAGVMKQDFNFLYGAHKSNVIVPIQEEGEMASTHSLAKTPDSEAPKPPKKRFGITAAMINEFNLLFYIVAVIVSTVGFVANMAVLHKAEIPEYKYTPIQELEV